MPKKPVYRTWVEFVCPNNHILSYIGQDSPEPPFCLSCLELWVKRTVKGVEQVD